MQFTRFLLLFLPPEQLRLFLHRGHRKESEGRRRSKLASFFFLLLRSLTTWGIEPESAQHVTYSLYQLSFSNTIRSKTMLLASSQMVSSQDIFSPLREPQNGTRNAFNSEKGSLILQRLNYRRVSVHIGVRFQTKVHVSLFRCLNIVSVSQLRSRLLR